MGRILGLLLTAAIAVAMTGLPAASGAPPARKLAIGHRGAAAYAPENTLAAFQLAIDQHADFIELDLAVSRDGVLICLHDDTLQRTTDAATRFPDRFRLTAAGDQVWLANDFTLTELRQLDAGRWRGAQFAGEAIPTWDEVVTLARGRIGLYPEIKSPRLYASLGVDIVRLFADSVRAHGLDDPSTARQTPLIVQSFDENAMRQMAAMLPTVPRSLLTVRPDDVVSDQRLREIATFATSIGADKHLLARHPDLVARAHLYGLTVTGWTFAVDHPLPRRSVRDEMSHYLYALGVDAIVTDNPDQFPRR